MPTFSDRKANRNCKHGSIVQRKKIDIKSLKCHSPFKLMLIPIKPAGYVLSVLTLPSTKTWRCIKMAITSLYVRAYFSLFRRMRIKGRHSLDLCGPDDGLGACTTKKFNA